MTRIQKIQYLR